jgi:hypothetical protein
MEKIQLIKVKTEQIGNSLGLTKVENYTTNKDYLGHTKDNIPV